MITYRNSAVIIGILFITATASAILSIVAMGSTLDPPGYLSEVSANENRVVIAVILELILGVSVLAIGFLFFPVLKRDSESLALAYVVFRLVEGLLIIIASVSLLSLLTLSQEFVTGALDVSHFQSTGESLLAMRDWAFVIGTMIFLGAGGLSLNYILFRSKLVPRWLSSWGLIGAALILLYGFLEVFSLAEPAAVNILAAPIAIQEMVFALWLIAKGFDESALAVLE